MKIIAIPTLDGSDCIYATREGVQRVEEVGDLGCSHINCGAIKCKDCQLCNKPSWVRLDDLEHYIFECETNAETEKKYKEALDNE